MFDTRTDKIFPAIGKSRHAAESCVRNVTEPACGFACCIAMRLTSRRKWRSPCSRGRAGKPTPARLRRLRPTRGSSAIAHAARARRRLRSCLKLGFPARQVALEPAGGKWSGIPISKQWNRVPDTFRVFITLLRVLVCLTMNDDDIDGTRTAA
ncbi:hypothetical protein R0290_30050 [Burkholderia semiarida]|uniref:hypothetical protein n=1 Tax=Burkholderia TaxID=32008 RepID=UPI00265DAA9E|nr:hypothetical protein [Burkholderia sp. AU44665]MDN7700652.1 hypothetical protein [Burkholderia sp. AU44665]